MTGRRRVTCERVRVDVDVSQRDDRSEDTPEKRKTASHPPTLASHSAHTTTDALRARADRSGKGTDSGRPCANWEEGGWGLRVVVVGAMPPPSS
jgi:hypothetical protein